MPPVADNNIAQTQSDNATYAAANPNTFSGVPTKAPSAPSPTPPSNPAQPTTVVNSGTAASYTNNTLIPALQTAQQGIANQNLGMLNRAPQNSNTFALGDGSQYDVNGNPIKGPQTSQNGSGQQQTGQPTPPPEQTPGTPEHQLLNTPETGYHFEYAPDGTRTEVINGTNQAGFSMTPPAVPLTGQNGVTQQNGNTVKQMSDGSYANYDALGNYQGPASQQQYQDAQTAQTLSQSITQIANGTYPLSQTEQAQVNALQQTFQELIKQQEIANANLTGGTTVAMNLYGMGNSVAGMGEIKGTIDSGISKIADLNAKMVKAVSDMEESLRDKDMARMKTAYDLLTSAQKERQDNVDKLNTDIQNKAKDMRDYNFKVQQQQETEADNLRTYNLELQKQQDQVSQFNQTKDEQKREFNINSAREAKLADSTVALQKSEIYKNSLEAAKTKADIAAMTNPNGGTATPVPLNSAGVPSVSGQKAYLDNIAKTNPGLALTIKAAAEYRLDPSKVVSLTKGQREQFDQMVLAYNPNYDAANYAAKAAYQKNLASGTMANAVTSANKSVNHISSLLDALSQEHNMSFGGKYLNDAANWTGGLFSSGKQKVTSKVETEANGVADELAKFFKGVGVTDVKSIDDWRKNITPGASPGAQQGFKEGALTLLTGQLDAMYAQYKANTGQNPPVGKILQPETLTKLQKLGVDITPYISGTPTGIVAQTAQTGTAEQKALIQQMVKDGKSDDDIAAVLGQ